MVFGTFPGNSSRMKAPPQRSRAERNRHLPIEAWRNSVDDDLDDNDRDHVLLQNSIEEVVNNFNKQMNSLRNVLVGILITLATSAVLLAINVVIRVS